MLTIWLQQALGELANLRSGEVFFLSDLFKGYEWKRISVPDRRQLGRMFLDQVTGQGNNYGVLALGKNSANHERYRKV
ncbi:MAG: single-stranded DNA-binding protein [Bacillota bacterium]